MRVWKYDVTWEKFKKSWEYRSLAFIGKFFGFVFLICYVYVGGQSFLMLVQKDINKRHDVQALHAVILESVAEDNLGRITAWVKLRPESETEEIINILTPESGSLEASVFFELSRRRLLQEKMEEALFWSQLGRYRLRYDVLRCGAGSSVEKIGKLLNFFAAPAIDDFLAQDPGHLSKSLHQVLDFDKKYPARNSPALLCKAISRMERDGATPVPPDEWGRVRDTLRDVTKSALKEMDAKK